MKLIRMLYNPVISMEYNLRMRSKKTPWIISLYLIAISAVIFLYIYFEMNNNYNYFNPNRSRELFLLLSYIQFTLVSFVTPGLTAGVISGEREKQTFNILLTTNLSPSKIILGKWFSSLSFMLLLMIATLPLYSIVFLYGGVSPLQLFKVFVFFIVSMLSIGAVGVLFSALIKKTGVATIVTYSTIVVYTLITAFIPPLINNRYYRLYGYGTNYQQPAWLEFIFSINPFYGLLYILEPRQVSSLKFSSFTVYLIFFMVVTIFALGLAIYLIKPVRRFSLYKR